MRQTITDMTSYVKLLRRDILEVMDSKVADVLIRARFPSLSGASVLTLGPKAKDRILSAAVIRGDLAELKELLCDSHPHFVELIGVVIECEREREVEEVEVEQTTCDAEV